VEVKMRCEDRQKLREVLGRIVERARAVPPEQMLALLTEGGRQLSDYFLLGESLFTILICTRGPGGLRATLIEDNVKACAATLFLLERGARRFASHEELMEAVQRERWDEGASA
jgi:hypothetical protein